MRAVIFILGVLVLPFPGPVSVARENGIGGLLADVKIECQSIRFWGTGEDGEHFIRYRTSCRVPERLKELPRERKASEWAALMCYTDQRYAVLAAAAALGRLHELTPQQRMRLALEVALREEEPLASARIGFVFGAKPWWDAKFEPGPGGKTTWLLGSLPLPFESSQTAVIREYLFPKVPHRPVSTLAVYLAKQLAEAGKLDPAIESDLRKVVSLKPKSFEAELARAALAALAGTKR